MREGMVLSMINSPYIPRCLDYGLRNGVFYIAAEFLEGQSLDYGLRNSVFYIAAEFLEGQAANPYAST
ncbi:hypothetical protein T484DRAFT_1847849 [Baffinella frigidus]|nr:hypothetical protein T484DRAFT_1847849 [Cryptophyta sp. CCMP2293]